MEDIKIPLDAGAPAKKLDEALATFLAALAFAPHDPTASKEARILAIAGALKHRNYTRDSIAGTITYAASLAQQVVAAAQAAGIVDGDVVSSLTVKD